MAKAEKSKTKGKNQGSVSSIVITRNEIFPSIPKLTKNKFLVKFFENPEYAEKAIQKNKMDHTVLYNYFESFRQHILYAVLVLKNLNFLSRANIPCSSHQVTHISK
jgi:hypothetical protein